MSFQVYISLSVHGMAVLRCISPNHGISIILKLNHPPQAEGKVQIPGLLAGTEGTVHADLAPFAIFDLIPPEEHVIALLLGVEERTAAFIPI